MPKALRHFNPAEINDSGTVPRSLLLRTDNKTFFCAFNNLSAGIGDLHYSKVKSVIRDKFYDYDLYYGIKLAISGSLVCFVVESLALASDMM